MKLGIFSWYGFQLPLTERLRAIRRAGFESTMLWWEDDPTTAPASPAVLDLATSLGLAIENVHLPFDAANDLWSDDPKTRAAFIERHINYLERCRRSGIPMVVMHVTKGYEISAPVPASLDNLRLLVTEAEKNRVTIAIENTRITDCLTYLLDGIESDYFCLCYDTSHGRLYEPESFYLMREYPHRIKNFHISDNDGESDLHHIPGRGVIDWDGFAAAFPACYTGCLSLEVYPDRDEIKAEVHLADACAALQALREKIEARRLSFKPERSSGC